MPLPAPSQPTFPRRRSKRSFRRRPPPAANTPPKTGVFSTDRHSQAKAPQANSCFDTPDANNHLNDPAHASSGSFRFRSSKHKDNPSGSSAAFRFQKSFSGKNINTFNINSAAASFSSLRFTSARNSQAQPPPSTTSLPRQSNASSPSLRFQSARSSTAAPPPSTSVPQAPNSNGNSIHHVPTPMPTTTYTSKSSSGSFRFQSTSRSPLKSKGMFRFKKSKSNKRNNDFYDSAVAAAVPDACAIVNRAVRTACVRKGVLKILMEIDSLVHYAQRDASTVDIMARRILSINSNGNSDVHCENMDFAASNVVAQKQLQAASSLHALRTKPAEDTNPVVSKAKTIIKSARTLIDSQPDHSNNNNEANVRLVHMERTLYQAANDLVDVDTNVTVREQILELLVLTARKRAEIAAPIQPDQHTPSSNISSSSSSFSSHQKPQYEPNTSMGQHEPVEDIDNSDNDSTEEKLEYVLKYQHQFQDWAPVTVKESFPGEKKTKQNSPKRREETPKHLPKPLPMRREEAPKQQPIEEKPKQQPLRREEAPNVQPKRREEGPEPPLRRAEETPKQVPIRRDETPKQQPVLREGPPKQQPVRPEEKAAISHEKYSAEETPNACTLITRSWKSYRLQCCNSIPQLKRLKSLRDDLSSSSVVFHRLKSVDALTNEVLILLGEVESMEMETLKTLAETYVTALVPLLASTRRTTSACIISRAVNGYRIRAEQLPVTLLRIETCVTAAVNRNTEQGYKEGLGKLRAIEDKGNTYISMVVQRGINAARLKLMQKLNGTRRIEELRTIARNNEAEARDREAVENKAQEWITWWTDYGIARSDLRLLLATLHRILPGWNDNDGDSENVLEISDPAKIRSIYRKALLHVHPDRLSRRKLEAFEAVMAQKIFVELQEAYNFFVENELNPSNSDDSR